jgi:hypothetical protein
MSVTRKLIAAGACLALSSIALAAPRTYVASFGSDANTATNCAPTAPCRTLAQAQTVTDSRGEIIVLDSAGYGPITITKSLSIIAPAGLYGGVVNAAGDGIVINTAGVDVVLRGLDINGQGTSTGSGIRFESGASLLVDRCTVSGFASSYPPLGVSAGGIVVKTGRATIVNSTVRSNGYGGVIFRGTGTTAETMIRGTVAGSLIENNGSGYGRAEDGGVVAAAGALVTVRNSVVSNNFRGLSACAAGASAPGAVLTVDNSIATRNVVGVMVAANTSACALRVSNSSITDNSLYGIEEQGGAVVTSLGNNLVYSNGAGESFGLSATPK